MYGSRLELLLVAASEEGATSRDAWGALVRDFAWIHRVGPQEALPTAVAASFDCALVEIRAEQGLELITAIRQAVPHLPVIAVARIDDPKAHRRALRLGAQDVLLSDRLHGATTLRSIEFAIERQRVWTALAQQASAQLSREEENKRNAQAERLSALGRLAGGIAHEINNPVALLAANIEFLSHRFEHRDAPGEHLAAVHTLPRRDDPVLASLLDDCRNAVHRIGAIVSDLGACAHIAKDELETIDLCEIVQSACASLPETAARETIVAQLQDVPPLIGHRSKLTQVAIALLTHALQATCGASRIVVSTRSEAKHVVLSVQDGGTGLAEELRQRIFDPFFHRGSPQGGRGLGLALAGEIIRGHRGEIRVEVEPGVGSRFEVHIPIAEAPLVPAPPPRALRRTRHKPRILLVDDEPAFLRAMTRLLERTYEITTAANGMEALARAPETFDAIVCDLMMPEMDGPTFYEQLVRLHPAAKSRIAFVTGGAFRDAVRRFLEHIPNPVLHKPFSAGELSEVIERLLVAARPTTQVTVAS